MVAGSIAGLHAQTASPDESIQQSGQAGPPVPPNPANDSVRPAGVDKAVAEASMDMLRNSDAAATQRLRFDVGDRVFFSAGSAELGSRARLVLLRQAHWLKVWKASVVIAGHGDEGGAADNDERVALRRAEAVRDRLMEEGIAPERLQVLGLGRRNPIADCPEPACAAQNRRAVIFIMGIKTDGAQH